MVVRAANEHDPETCVRVDASIARAFTLLGQRWTAVVLGTLSTGPTGFRQLARAVVGISDSMLSTRLSALTEAGLVTRTVDPGPPVAVVYELTTAGHALMPALEEIAHWAERHLPEPVSDTGSNSRVRRNGARSTA